LYAGRPGRTACRISSERESTPVNPVQDFVVRRRAVLSLSLRQVSAASGGLISRGTLSAIERGVHSYQFSDRCIRGLAVGLDVDEARVRELVGAPREHPGRFTLAAKAALLSPTSQRALQAMADHLLALESAAEAVESAAATESERTATEPDQEPSTV
jgi:hypothetical protein